MSILEIYFRFDNGWQQLANRKVKDYDEWQQVINECCKKFNVNEKDLLITPYIERKEEESTN